MVVQQAGDLVEKLKEAGFEEKRGISHKHGGDHHFFVHPDGRSTTVPFTRKKDSIAPGTYNAILRQAGLK